MWLLAFLIACIALSLLAKHRKQAPANKPKKKHIAQFIDAQDQQRKHEEIEQPSDLVRAMTPFSLNVTPRPESMRDAVMTDMDGQVHISVEHQTCTCMKFAERADRPMNNIGRWCRHLVNIMDARRAVDHENEWIKAIIEDGYDGPFYAFMVDRPTTGQILMTGGNSTEWLNFYARTTRKGETITQASGKIKRFGWSTTRKGWAFSKAPPGARELRALISEYSSVKITIE